VIGAIARAHGDDPRLQQRLRWWQRQALDDIAACGTPACGMHVQVCDHCGDHRLAPNTCGHRGCPHCQGRSRADWVAKRETELLPCSYFHAVLTLPGSLRSLAHAFPSVVLGALMRASSDCIDHLCRNPRHLGAEVGQLAVLHTWRRDLGWHPHVHIIVTAGGWDAARARWVPARRHGRARTPFLLPVDCLRIAFQRRLCHLLRQAYERGAFHDGPWEAFPALQRPLLFRSFLKRCCQSTWVIRIEPPFGGPRQLLKYLGAYVNRVAISPKRVIAYDAAAGTVTYTWRTNAEPDREQRRTLPAIDFLRRFAQHILPPRFHRIRFRGLWSTAHRKTKLWAVQVALGAAPRAATAPQDHAPRADTLCRMCNQGHYVRLPGPCPRPRRRDRLRYLWELRHAQRVAIPQEGLGICA
jgi:hypothetical protein